jgi:RNA polymerase sigma-70 factor (ECF subfamily)
MEGTEVEAAVVGRAREGQPDALAELYRRFGPRVFGLCRHLLGTPDAAADATGEVFLRLGRILASYDAAQPFAPWLLSVTAHHCVDVLRRRRVERRLFAAEAVADVPDPAEADTTLLDRVLLAERRDALRQALAALPEHYRVVLALRYYGDLSYDAIAAELGLSRNHVATLLFRGKQALRRTLARMED